VCNRIGTYDRLEFEIADVLGLRRAEEIEQEEREKSRRCGRVYSRVSVSMLEDNDER
jgi:hypothetical protein